MVDLAAVRSFFVLSVKLQKTEAI